MSREITITISGSAKPVTVVMPDYEAAAVARICQKFGHSDAAPYLYPHVAKELRSDQAYHMVHGATRLAEAFSEAGVSSWPWIEFGAEG